MTKEKILEEIKKASMQIYGASNVDVKTTLVTSIYPLFNMLVEWVDTELDSIDDDFDDEDFDDDDDSIDDPPEELIIGVATALSLGLTLMQYLPDDLNDAVKKQAKVFLTSGPAMLQEFLTFYGLEDSDDSDEEGEIKENQGDSQESNTSAEALTHDE